MVPYSLLSAMLDFIGLASTVTITVWLVSSLQPLFERVRDSCRACQPPEGRALLLWSVFLIHLAWVGATAFYLRNLFSLWDFMGTWLEKQPINRPVYALLHLYLFFLLVCGIYAWAITVFEISQNRKVFIDLFMIARFNTRRYQAMEDLEAQHGSFSTDPIDAEAETPSAVGDDRNTSSLPQDEGSRRNDQESNGDVASTEARINKPEHPTEEAAWCGLNRPVGEIITRTVYSPIRSVKYSSWPIGEGWNNSEAAGPSNQQHPTLDSDGDAIIITPSSSSSSNDDDRYDRQGVRLREPLEDREKKYTKASYTVDERGYVEEDDDDDDDPYGLYYATPLLSPQDQNARADIEPLDIGEPPSPCDSCSSAHAESIPTAKRSPVRVPITPTSPTADANDADTEKTDVERKKRERKNRNSAMSAPQSPQANTSRVVPPYHTATILHGIDPSLGDNKSKSRIIESNTAALTLEERERGAALGEDEENTRVPESNLAAHALEQREGSAANTRTSGKPKPKPKPSPISAPALYARPATPPLDLGRESGLLWRSREADKSASAASRDENAYLVSFDGKIMADTRTRMRRTVQPPMRSPRQKRPGSPYPFADGLQVGGAEGGRGPRDLSLEIPDAGLGSHGREGG